MRRNVTFFALCAVVAAGFAAAPYLAFVVAPVEPAQGFIQKIFYFHVPCAWAALLGALICGGAGAVYLFSGGRRGDGVVAASAELTVLFGVLVMITGPLWAKGAWGQYWRWDVRLTSSAVLLLIFIAVLISRRYGGSASRRIGAALALFGAADVPLIYLSVQLWQTYHPKTSVVPSLGPRMRLAFFVGLAAFTALFALLLWARLSLERIRVESDELALRLSRRGAVR